MHIPSLAARLGLALLLCAGAVRAQAFDELVPEGTIFYLSVEDFSRTQERFESGPLHALWTDEAVKAFLEQPLKQWDMLMEEAKKETGMAPGDLIKLVQGQVAFAVTGVVPREGQDDDVRMVVMADIGENAGKLRELIDTIEGRLREQEEFRREEEEFEGVTIVRYLEPGGEDAETEKVSTAWLLDGSFFAAAPDPENLRQLLARRANPDETSLAARETYRRSRERMGGRGDLVVWLDAQNLFAALNATMEDTPNDQMMMNVFRALGLMDVQGVGLEMALEPKAVSMRMFMPMAGPRRGVMLLLGGENAALEPPRWVPADVTGLGMMVMDLNVIWAEVVRIANEIQPGMGMMMEAAMESVKNQMGVDIKKDLLGSMGNELLYYVRLPDPNAPGAFLPIPGNVQLPQFALAFKLNNQQAFDTALNALVMQGIAMGAVQEQEYLDVKLRVIPTPMGFSPAFAVLADQFVFALSVDDIKEIVSRYGKPDIEGLIDREEFTRSMERVPAQRCMFGWSDMVKGMRQNVLMAIMQAGAGAQLFNEELMPSEEVLRKYLGAAVSVGRDEEDGYLIDYKIELKPPPATTQD